MSTDDPPLDLALLGGFSFACRPDCGLCCFAEPTVAPAERGALLRVVPPAPLGRRDGREFVRSYPDGGSCRLLTGHRCRAHAARPGVCRQFPLMVHVGARAQATVVLTCPGVDLRALGEYTGPDGAAPPVGFDEEVAAVRARARALPDRLAQSARERRRLIRTLEATGRWEEEEDVRERWRSHLPEVLAEDFPAEDPPSSDVGIERLPLTFAGRAAPVALHAEPGGWALSEVGPTGGWAQPLGVFPPPSQRPEVDAAGRELLRGYQRYWLERDALFGYVHLALLADPRGSVGDRVEEELRAIAALVLARAYVLAVARGSVGALTASDVAAGVRAVDMDLLDRPSSAAPL